MAGSWIRLGTVLLAAGLVAGCGADRDVRAVEETLVEAYLDPLAAAGITAAVTDTCKYAGGTEEPWHLSVELRLAAPEAQVAEVLESEGMVVRRDREPMIVQQVPGGPRDGWNGVLAATADGSTLSLVFNNATHADRHGTVGWSEVCPTPQS
ncbi:hypothetical protein [Catellatospora coxensis]|uniref:Lipoprotein n=1 Tax=Catellatospora coxensis TaxID=310354 RepID=A0A8J3KZN1_9ACTN|nr:hypothetical protein [Catellatospora coxensis]GIG05976.1 hypothetical protein Cco03nite_26760 [Catellatospora coxensis]